MLFRYIVLQDFRHCVLQGGEETTALHGSAEIDPGLDDGADPIHIALGNLAFVHIGGELFGGGVINVILKGIFIISGNFSAKNALITTMLSIILFVIVGARYSEKRLKIKLKFFSWEILRYFVVSFLFIPITYAVKALNYGYWFNILVSITLCVTVYGIFMLITKDPLVQIIANKIMRKSE